MGHRRFIPHSNPLRKRKAWFDNTVEDGKMPRVLTGKNISLILKDFLNNFGKGAESEKKSAKGKGKKRKIDDNSEDDDNGDNDPIKKELSRWKKNQSFLTCHIGRLAFI